MSNQSDDAIAIEWQELLQQFAGIIQQQAKMNRKPMIGELAAAIKSLSYSITTCNPGDVTYVNLLELRDDLIIVLEHLVTELNEEDDNARHETGN